jgi:hypothetical protein
MSTTTLFSANDRMHEYHLHLFKEDGWYDTGLPITTDTAIIMMCPRQFPVDPPNAQIEAMIGGHVIYPPPPIPFRQAIDLYIRPSREDPKNLSAGPYQYLSLPEQSLTTLKLRIYGDNAPESVQYMVSIYVEPFDHSHPQIYTPAQERERAELAKWELK